ncbi:MAG: phage terminase small subunit [Bacillota bacterium]|nr:phage terminase small subunit [Bacillota bacterium]
MASSIHKKAEKDYLKGLKYKELAEKYNVSLNTIKSWKQRYSWSRKGVHTKEKVCIQKTGAPKGNKNALGNKGGAAPRGNKNAETHGFFSRIFPDDPETMAIINEIGIKSPLDILWENIVIQYTAIARAQRVMFVQSKEEMIKELKKFKSERDVNPRHDTENRESEPFEETFREEEYEFQFAWDRQATFLNAQARAVATLMTTIEKYQKMLPKTLEYEEQQLKVQKLKAEIAKITDDEDSIEDDGFLEALEGKVSEVWDDAEEN